MMASAGSVGAGAIAAVTTPNLTSGSSGRAEHLRLAMEGIT
jgi:hypothetical protein